MIDLDRMAASLAILVDTCPDKGFAHLSTAWCLGEGEWISAWTAEQAPSDTVKLLQATTGALLPIENWEHAEGVAGFCAPTTGQAVPLLKVAGGDALVKREALRVVAYPSVIDHPAFALATKSLNAERYYPYLCPWQQDGHVALFSAQDAWLTGQFYPGMAGAPVMNNAGGVVGMVLDGSAAAEHLPLTRFRRLQG